jgi:hypothetical protein
VGHRANYIIIENRQTSIYYTRFGALNIPTVLLEGPEATYAYIHKQTLDDILLDSVWAEGGLLMDIDNRFLCFYNDFIKDYCIKYLIAALSLVWVGWNVKWATQEVAEFARIISGTSTTGIAAEEPLVADADREEIDNSALVVPRQQAIDELIEALTRESAFSPTIFYQELTRNGEYITVGKGFWNDNKSTLTPEQRKELLQQLFARVP